MVEKFVAFFTNSPPELILFSIFFGLVVLSISLLCSLFVFISALRVWFFLHYIFGKRGCRR